MLIGMIAVLAVAAIIGGLAFADVVLHWMLALALGIFLGGVIYGLVTRFVPVLFGEGRHIGSSSRIIQKPHEVPPKHRADPDREDLID